MKVVNKFLRQDTLRMVVAPQAVVFKLDYFNSSFRDISIDEIQHLVKEFQTLSAIPLAMALEIVQFLLFYLEKNIKIQEKWVFT